MGLSDTEFRAMSMGQAGTHLTPKSAFPSTLYIGCAQFNFVLLFFMNMYVYTVCVVFMHI